MWYVKSQAISQNRKIVFYYCNYHVKFQDAEGLKKKEIYAIVLSIAPVHWIFTRTILGASCRWQKKIGIDLVWKISDGSIKLHIKYMLPIFSNANEANFDYKFSLTIFEM